MIDELVKFETAKLAKSKGFQRSTQDSYNDGDILTTNLIRDGINSISLT